MGESGSKSMFEMEIYIIQIIRKTFSITFFYSVDFFNSWVIILIKFTKIGVTNLCVFYV